MNDDKKDVVMEPEEDIVETTEEKETTEVADQPEDDIVMELAEAIEAEDDIIMEPAEAEEEAQEEMTEDLDEPVEDLAESEEEQVIYKDDSEDIDDQISMALASFTDEVVDVKEDAKYKAEQTDEEMEFSMVNAALASQFGEDDFAEPVKKKRHFIPVWLMVSLCILFGIALTGTLLVTTTPGKRLVTKIVAAFIAGHTQFDDGKDVTPIPEHTGAAVINPGEQNTDPSNQNGEQSGNLSGGDILTPGGITKEDGEGYYKDEDKPKGGIRHEEGIYNILLLGEEAMLTGGGRGRTDAIMIATLDTVNSKVKLTSITRDTLVYIPEYNVEDIINSVYTRGGIQLLYQVIEQNFSMKMDGYILVGFDCFEDIVDAIGGVDIKLTETEAEYLRTTNYISEKKYRNVVAGVNHMNGNQALGYCRVRGVGTSTGEGFDFGRTSRHRVVLDAIFTRCKELNWLELSNLLFKVLRVANIKTDITDLQWQKYLEEGFAVLKANKGLEMEQMRIPLDGTFEFDSDPYIYIENGIEYKGVKDFIVIDRLQTTEILHKFIFGNYIE